MYLPYVNRIDSLTIDFDPVWSKCVHSVDRIEMTSVYIKVLVRTGLKFHNMTLVHRFVPSVAFSFVNVARLHSQCSIMYVRSTYA